MKCEICGRREATATVAMVINNKKTVHPLCTTCRERIQRGGSFFTQMVMLQTIEAPEPELCCPVCNTAWADIKRHGRVGCAQCYQTFAPQLETLMVRLGGEPQRQDQASEDASVDEKEQKLRQLREAMFAAVNAEEYERAAQLRDEIRLLEQEGGETAE